jgi:hypothetical protein
LDYRIWRAVEDGTFEILVSTVDLSMKVVALTPGTNYSFKV